MELKGEIKHDFFFHGHGLKCIYHLFHFRDKTKLILIFIFWKSEKLEYAI